MKDETYVFQTSICFSTAFEVFKKLCLKNWFNLCKVSRFKSNLFYGELLIIINSYLCLLTIKLRKIQHRNAKKYNMLGWRP
jgi:hypothetical protein